VVLDGSGEKVDDRTVLEVLAEPSLACCLQVDAPVPFRARAVPLP
jgi:hypothetical protein